MFLKSHFLKTVTEHIFGVFLFYKYKKLFCKMIPNRLLNFIKPSVFSIWFPQKHK